LNSPEGCTWLPREPIARHTAVRAGGPCVGLMVVHRAEALFPALEALRDQKVEWLGAGTRTLVRDAGWDRALLRLGVDFNRAAWDGSVVEVGGAMPCAALAWSAAARGRLGLQDLAARAGSVGAMVSLDDGPFRASLVEVASVFRGSLRWRNPEEARGKPVVAARFATREEPRDRALAITRAALAGRRSVPPWYQPMKRGSAEQELRRVQAVGVRLRGVLIPDDAPEMIVNPGRGPASDLQLLHASALERVKTLRGVELTSSVTWFGRTS